MKMPHRHVAVVAALAILAVAMPARAFGTRIHIVFANRIRAALVLSNDGTIPLQQGDRYVQLPLEDALAIVDHPYEFRAGAIGPDSFVFVALTDGTHAVENNPFTQCELLYQDAVTEEERAYALGCFIHGSTDAVAHHFVNYFSGETWTNNPVSAGRASSWLNPIRHIVMESAIQRAIHIVEPGSLDATALQLQFPDGFILRNYYDQDSPMWPVMSVIARRKLDMAQLTMPSASLYDQIGAANLAPVEYLELAPVIVDNLQLQREDLRTWVQAQIAQLQDPLTSEGAMLLVGAGPDGTLGTSDDTTDCDATCPDAFAKYWVYVRMLQPRMDAGGRPLPSAFDKVSDELGMELQQFMPALVATIENLVALLNAPIAADAGDAFEGIDGAVIDAAFQPMDDWVTATTTLDYDTVSRAVAPDWYTGLSDFLRGLGVDISIGSILQLVLQPYVDEIRNAVQDYVIGQARVYLEEFVTEYRTARAAIEAEFLARLVAAEPVGLSGNPGDHFFDSGLYANSFNLAAATLANHAVMVPPDGTDSVLTGPASFDASHSVAWTQAALCPYLRDDVFPFGIDVRADLTVRDATGEYPGRTTEDATIECQDGSLTMWDTTPGPDSCRFVRLDDLIAGDHFGSPSRAYPPENSAMPALCRGIVVPGLLPPPDAPDAGVGADLGPTPPAMSERGGGCCSVAGARSGSDGAALGLFALALLGLWSLRRGRRRALAATAGALLVLTALGCGGDDGVTPLGDAGVDMPATPMDAAMDDDAGTDAGPNLRRMLLEALGSSTWSATQTRTEGSAPRTRVYELRFRATELFWAEIRNPFGPARERKMRSFMVEADGRTVTSIVITPTGWPVPPDNGQRDTWSFELVDGSPRTLRVTDSADHTEIFSEGAWPAPTDGLTAQVRVFPAGGVTDMALCTSGISSIARNTIWDFARFRGADPEIASDVVAGAHLREWDDASSGAFGVTDIDGFDQNGGTLLSDTGNFVVRYTGVVHFAAGGALWARERDDSLDNWALWMFGGAGVGGTDTTALWLEAVGFSTIFDATSDPNSISVASGDVPIEVIILRCAGASSEPLDAELSVDDEASWAFVGDTATAPTIDTTLFPAAL